ncbi:MULTISPECIES: oligosaccharide flippase family protein [Proteus]|uniref:oligosaccharide flippase family protein n=1 Tax=Proteus TaxID=583 RepID=UPI000C1F472C|nr:oligosaccharide flippase family protein [Proteus columbae]
MNNLIKNSLFLLGMQGINYLIPLISLPYLTRKLGFYEYGMISTALNIILYLMLFIDFGFNFSTTKDIAKSRNNKLKIQRIYSATIYSKIIIASISILILLILIRGFQLFNDIESLIYVMLPQLIYAIFFPLWLYQGLEKISFISICSVVSKIITLPLLFFYVKDKNDIYIAGIILSWSYLLPLIINYFYLHKNLPYIKIEKINFSLVLSILKKSSIIFWGSISISLYTLSTPIILSLVSNYDQVGIFTATDKLRIACIGIFLILGQAIYPRVNILLSESKKKYNLFIKKIIIYQISFCSITSLLFFLLMPYLAPILLGNTFIEMKLIIQLMSPMIILIPLSVIISNFILLPHGMNKIYAIIPTITLFFHIIYTIPLSENYGAIGSSIAILITEIISLSLLLISYFFFIKNK